MYKADELKERTKQFAIRIVKMTQSLSRSDAARTLGRQVLRSGTAVAANYRATCRARSRAEFIAKLGVVVEEIDETVLWLELLVDTGIVPAHKLDLLLNEARQLLALFAASQATARRAANEQMSK